MSMFGLLPIGMCGIRVITMKILNHFVTHCKFNMSFFNFWNILIEKAVQ